MQDLKFITASNIINLRTKAGMTQSELAAKLSYSDKSVSKWERAEAVPDAYVLKNMSEIFGVTVDYLLSEHDQWEAPKKKTLLDKYQIDVIISVTLMGIATLALLIYVVFWLVGDLQPIIFVYATTVMLITLLVLQSVFKNGEHNYIIIAFLLFAVISSFYFTFREFLHVDFWQLFILLAPGWLIIYLCSKVKRKNVDK